MRVPFVSLWCFGPLYSFPGVLPEHRPGRPTSVVFISDALLRSSLLCVYLQSGKNNLESSGIPLEEGIKYF